MVVLGGALVLSACGAPSSEISDTQTPALQLEPCDERLLPGRGECGRFAVPENPDEPGGRQIELNILRLPALASAPAPDPLFVLAGGPGEAATDLVDRLPPVFRKINQTRDIVLVDQRGTGQSNPLDCTPEQPVDLSLSSAESFLVQEQRLRECLATYDADVRYYTTPFFADDLEAVRRALNYPQINLWGGSYGSRAALIYMRRHPGSVRAAVLDGVAPTAIQLPHYAGRDADESLGRLFAACDRNHECRERFGDLEAKTRALVASLDRTPRKLSLEHPSTQQDLTLHMDGQLLAGLIRLALYQRDLAPLLPLAIEAAERGDFRPFSLLLVTSEQVAQSVSLGLQQTILCAEDVTRPAPALEPSNSILKLQVLRPMQRICEFWPQGILPAGYFEPVHSDKPVLLLSGELDPVTPPRWGDVAAETLSNSRHVRVPGAHHIVSHTGCVDSLVADFIADPRPAELETACVARVELRPPFLTPAGPLLRERGDE
ncbi:alpha/beta hydrolase [Gilvimarinus sp. F26214L]|uniref:alpha/beta hydrolase n=1 Tax=Gilvimarinus sp. DZF01 TaxID=3461371 RepID=UPI0040465569